MSKPIKITKEIASKVLKVVNKGLSCGLGHPTPGKMCVEAAVAFVTEGLHHDQPKCVTPCVADIKIALNDSFKGSNKARAKFMQKLAIAQLGSKGVVRRRSFDSFVFNIAMPRLKKYLKDNGLTAPAPAWNGLDTINRTFDGPSMMIYAAQKYSNTNGYLAPKHVHAILEIVADSVLKALKKLHSPGVRYLSLVR